MNCKNCGTALDNDSLFCPNCGSAVTKEEPINNASMSLNSAPVNDLNASASQINPVNDLNNMNSMNNINPVNDLNNMNSMNNMNSNNIGSMNNMSSANTGSSNNNGSSRKTNSNLKNALIIILVCLILCGGAAFVYFKFFNNNGYKVVENAINNMLEMNASDTKGFTFKMDMDMVGSYDGVSETVKAGLTADIDLKNKMSKINLNASAEGMTIDIPAYIDLNTGSEAIYFKNPMESSWNKLSFAGMIPTDQLKFENNQKLVFEDYLKDYDFITSEKSDIKNMKKYKMNFNKDLIAKLEKDSLGTLDLSMLEEYGLTDGFSIDVYVDTKDNYITKMALDLSGVELDGVKLEKYVISFEITNMNKISDVVIPDEAKNATELDMSSLFGPFGSIDLDTDYDMDYDFDVDYSDDEMSDFSELSF